MQSNSTFLAQNGKIFQTDFVVGNVNYIFKTKIYGDEVNTKTENHTFYISAESLDEAIALVEHLEATLSSITKIDIIKTVPAV